jgi:hypothetical protein
MTKEQFISGTPFTIGKQNYKGESTYYFDGGSISRQIRSSVDNRVALADYECNVLKIGRTGFEGYTFILKKKVVVKYRFEDLEEFKEEA